MTTRTQNRRVSAQAKLPARFKGIRPAAESFFSLNHVFPLRRIRSDQELAAALEVAGELMRGELDEDAADYLDVLTDLIQKYETVAYSIPDATEADVLKLLMEGRGLSQSALKEATGIAQSTISTVLGGTRSLTKEHVVTLATFFKVSPLVFMARV